MSLSMFVSHMVHSTHSTHSTLTAQELVSARRSVGLVRYGRPPPICTAGEALDAQVQDRLLL